MLQALYRAIFILVLSYGFIPAYSQTFYVNTGHTSIARANSTYKLNAVVCDTISDSVDLTIHTCLATYQPLHYIDTTYNDIAIDRDSNIWYVTASGFLYKRKLNDPGSCQYVGDFTDTLSTFSGMVADTAGVIYAAGNTYNHCFLYKYDNSGFKRLGSLPEDVLCAGDLFFYKHRLFMTCLDYSNFDSSFLYEIVLEDPSQSCHYMSLKEIPYPWGAFSFVDSNNNHRVLISSSDTVSHNTSALVEVDIPNKKVLDTFCNYPFLIRGAAAHYAYSGDTTHCPVVPKSVVTTTRQDEQLTIYNPSNQTIRINTNINQHDIRTIDLYDLYGKKVRHYTANDFPNNLAIADLSDGMYILHIAAGGGKQWKEKMVKGGW